MDARIARFASSFDEQDADLVGGDPLRFDGYTEQLRHARDETGLAEACVWGWATIEANECALVVIDFHFMGGSMGVAVGEKVARAFDAARERRLPVVSVCASGGARMQEGMVALIQMAKTALARSRHAAEGLAHVSMLTSPTTGGVYASFASLADVVLAEPRATIGFAGPRVITDLTGQTPDASVHTAEFASEHGLVDELVPRAEQRETIGRVLRNLTSKPPPAELVTLPFQEHAGKHGPSAERRAPTAVDQTPSAHPTPFERLEIARHPDRPKAPRILDALLSDAFEFRGDRLGSDDRAVVVRAGAVAGGRRVLAVGQDSTGGGRMHASGFRKTIRLLRLAPRYGLPVVTLIDTPGADPLPDSEAAGIVPAIASTFVSLLECPTPTLAVVTGEGGSGGALAMAVCDRVIAWENAVFSVIAPEGAASILYRDSSRGPELAGRLRITAEDLVDLGVADAVVSEPPGGAHTDPSAAAEDLSRRIAEEVERLEAMSQRKRLRERHRRWREAGNGWIEHIRP